MSLQTPVKSILALFQSFIPGQRLVDGNDLLNMAKLQFSATGGLVATVGGTALTSTLIPATYTEVDTSTGSNTDSVVLPPALPGSEVVINNNTANTIVVFASLSNPNNNSVADKIVDTTSTAQVASTTQTTGIVVAYVCFMIGVWKRVKSAA